MMMAGSCMICASHKVRGFALPAQGIARRGPYELDAMNDDDWVSHDLRTPQGQKVRGFAGRQCKFSASLH